MAKKFVWIFPNILQKSLNKLLANSILKQLSFPVLPPPHYVEPSKNTHKKLYKKGLNDPDNHDGVVTHLE